MPLIRRPIVWRSTRKSPFFDADKLQRGIGIRFKGTVRTNIEEYCISEGWVRVQAGKAMDRKGQPLTIKLSRPGRGLVRGPGRKRAGREEAANYGAWTGVR